MTLCLGGVGIRVDKTTTVYELGYHVVQKEEHRAHHVFSTPDQIRLKFSKVSGIVYVTYQTISERDPPSNLNECLIPQLTKSNRHIRDWNGLKPLTSFYLVTS